MFNPLHSSTNQIFKKNLSNQSIYSHYENIWTFSITNGSHHMPTTKLTLFTASKDEWDTKEGTGKSMKNALYAHKVK